MRAYINLPLDSRLTNYIAVAVTEHAFLDDHFGHRVQALAVLRKSLYFLDSETLIHVRDKVSIFLKTADGKVDYESWYIFKDEVQDQIDLRPWGD